MSENKTYHLKYVLCPVAGEFTKEELKFTDEELAETLAVQKENPGGTDMMFLVSIITGENPARSYMFVSKDGHTDEEMAPHEIFKMWHMLANALSEMEGLGEAHQEFCKQTFESFIQHFMPEAWARRMLNRSTSRN